MPIGLHIIWPQVKTNIAVIYVISFHENSPQIPLFYTILIFL